MPTLSHQVALLETLTLNAYPALSSLFYDGWLLRFANGFTRRANSVALIAPSTLPLDEKIAYCQAAYGRAGLPTVFKLTGDPAAQPDDLEARLIARGYTRDHAGLMTLQVCDALPMLGPGRTAISDHMDEDWLAAYIRLNGVDPAQRATKRAVMNALLLPAGFARITDSDGQIIAVAQAVIERGWAGIYGVVTDPAHRGQGLASTMMADLLVWAAAHGAQRSYLQMLATNAPARRVYDRLGYHEVYHYWYVQTG